MFVPGKVATVKVEEPVTNYGSVYSNENISKRFNKAIEDYLVKHQMRQRDLCDKWQLTESHISGVRKGYKPITTGMIIAAIEHGRFNLNYIIGGTGPMYIMEEIKTVTDYLNIIKSQQQTIERLSQPEQQKKRA